MFRKYSVSWVVIFVTFLVLAGTGYADPIDADFSQVNGTCLGSTPDQYRMDNISVQYTDADTGQSVSGFFDVIFKWDPENYVLVPVALAGMQNGHLRVQVSDSVTGSPIQGANVSVLNQNVLTDDDGIARFNALPDQKLGVRISQAGYENMAVDVEIPSSGSTRMLAVQIMPMVSAQ
jgi:hypothetical protein